MSFQNTDLQMQTTCQHWSAATLWPPCPLGSQPVCSHTHSQFGPLQTAACAKTLGDWPPLRTPLSPLPSPLPLTPSATDHCLLSLSSTALLVRGAGRIVTLLSGPPLQPPPLPTRPDPIHSPQKHHLYHPTVREWERGRDGARRGKKTRRGERRWRPRREGGKGRGEKGRENERHLNGCCAVCRKVSVK